MKPPVSYYGGKQRLAGKIVGLIPKHRIYVEPFAGGLAVFFRKGILDTPEYIEVINDKDSRLVNFYKVIQNPRRRKNIIDRLKFTPYSREVYQDAKAYLLKPKKTDELILAYYYFIAINWAYANKLHGGWTHAKSKREGRSSHTSKIKRLEDIRERMSEVYIEHKDALDVIKTWDSKESFFYLDPPYPNTNQGHYTGFSEQDFKTLLSNLRRVKGKFILSCYEHNLESVSLPKSWNIVRHQTVSTVSPTRSARTEILICKGCGS